MALFDRNKSKNWRDGTYLTTVRDSFLADILESKLRAEGIPCVKNYRGSSNFMEIALGSNTTQDIDIYVPEECIEKARETITPVPIEDDFEEV